MRKLAISLVVLFALGAKPAHAEAIGIGLFLGEPSGLDLKVGLGAKSAIDVVIGATTFRDNRTDYFHLTYLLTPFFARGRSVIVPFRIGIGGAALGVVDGNAHFAVRVPLEIGFRFRRTPLEIYGEVAIKGTFVEEDFIHFDADGGIGIRFYF